MKKDNTLLPDHPHWSAAGRTPTTRENRTGWMLFHHSGVLNLQSLTAEQVDIRDIVHGLGRINRFNGQTTVPISVLWHSLMVHALCENAERETALEALFHDAGETYVGDWIRPLSGLFGPELTNLRHDVQQRCFEAAGLKNASAVLSPTVRTADQLMVRYELESTWGYDRSCTWHATVTEPERAHAEQALLCVGKPGDGVRRREFLEHVFIETAAKLLPKTAPIFRSVQEALHDRTDSRPKQETG